jgi:two-component system response regulator VicR
MGVRSLTPTHLGVVERRKIMRTLTTGEIAKYCDVNFRTVIRWIEKGHIKAFKLPGRGNNRVMVNDFIDFLKKHDIPIPQEFQEFTRRILIVDDDKAMANSIRRILKSAGYETKLAHNGFEAGDALRSFVPQLMTLDLAMPGLDGMDVLRYVRSIPSLSSLKILVISALPDLEKALDEGADDMLTKPFEREELLNKIDALLSMEPEDASMRSRA